MRCTYRKETGFSKAEKPSSSQYARVVIGKTHTRHRCTPEEPSAVKVSLFTDVTDEYQQTHIIVGMNIEGLSFLSSTLVSGSNTEYEMKKMVRAMLYCPVDKCKSVRRPATFALPMLVRSRKARRYNRQS
jgi:hypothetical protein